MEREVYKMRSAARARRLSCEAGADLARLVAWMQRSGIRGGDNGLIQLCRIANGIPGFRLRLHPGYMVGVPILGAFGGMINEFCANEFAPTWRVNAENYRCHFQWRLRD